MSKDQKISEEGAYLQIVKNDAPLPPLPPAEDSVDDDLDGNPFGTADLNTDGIYDMRTMQGLQDNGDSDSSDESDNEGNDGRSKQIATASSSSTNMANNPFAQSTQSPQANKSASSAPRPQRPSVPPVQTADPPLPPRPYEDVDIAPAAARKNSKNSSQQQRQSSTQMQMPPVPVRNSIRSKNDQLPPVPARNSIRVDKNGNRDPPVASYPNFHGSMDRNAAEQILKRYPPGAFLIRTSRAVDGYVFSVNTMPGKHVHVRVNKTPRGGFATSDQTFDTFQELLFFYTSNSIHSGVALGFRVPK